MKKLYKLAGFMLFIPLFVKTDGIHHVIASSPPSLRLVFCSRFIFLHHGSGSGNAAVRAKEDDVEENNAVAANEVPPVVLG